MCIRDSSRGGHPMRCECGVDDRTGQGHSKRLSSFFPGGLADFKSRPVLKDGRAARLMGPGCCPQCIAFAKMKRAKQQAYCSMPRQAQRRFLRRLCRTAGSLNAKNAGFESLPWRRAGGPCAWETALSMVCRGHGRRAACSVCPGPCSVVKNACSVCP